MRIAIFGATGKTGLKVTELALIKGFDVKVLVRNPAKMTISNPKLEVIRGDVTNYGDVEKVTMGTDAVIVTLGASSDMISDIVLADGTKNIVRSMKNNQVRRIIVMSSYAMNGSKEGVSLLKQIGMTDKQISTIKPIFADKMEQERITRNSGLDFIIIRPVMLTDGDQTENYRVSDKMNVSPGDSISRADVADFILKSINSDEWWGRTVILSN
ncbi:SDR family oxidoreductase [Candidatus Shapirobacteria bacterium]|jgi:putative NADH-flavin reductase|nr:SDR family oxidoreductase [Candidatus Shapirobacteria bacterium]